MKTIKSYIFNRFRMLFALFLLSSGSLFLLLIRFKLTESFYLLFLVWNLFLATIPFVTSSYLLLRERSKLTVFLLGGLWLLFLPNAPYIVTDLIHLRNSPRDMLWLDALMICLFAITGLFLYAISVRDMLIIIQRRFNKQIARSFSLLLPFLVGLGVYLGRFLRWNSWDILQNPSGVTRDIMAIFRHPISHKQAWLITFSFGLLLIIVLDIWKRIGTNSKSV